MSSSNSLIGIILSNSYNDSIIEYITIINGIYLAKKYKLNWLFLNEDFEWPKEFVKDLQKVKPVVDEDELDWID